MNTTAQHAEVQEKPIELTPEQIKEAREQRSRWYKDQVSFLKPQLEYQRLVSEIEVCKATTAEAQLKQAQIYLAIKGGQPSPDGRQVKRHQSRQGAKQKADMPTSR
ncbi:MAG TPA: hypothetical protein VGM30_10665 [Puia sp.]|jgi:hypothetical protein